MGVSTEIWRARIGAYLPVMRAISANSQRRIWPVRKRFRAYQRPPEDEQTHHVTIGILLCLLMFSVACFLGQKSPLENVRQLGGCWVGVSAFVVNLGLSHERTKWTWKERLSAALRMVLLVLLLLCGDVESNPGPSPTDGKLVASGRNRVHKILRTDTNEKFGAGMPTLADVRTKISTKWPKLHVDGYTLKDGDGTEICDEDYFQSLANKSVIAVHPKIPDVRSSGIYSAPLQSQPLTDDVIFEISTNRLSHNISKLGLAMGVPFDLISKYEAANRELIWESRGTRSMILDWRERSTDSDKLEAFCRILREAEKVELADDLFQGRILNRERTAQSPELSHLQRALEQYYVDVLCYVRTIPWRKDSAVPINDFFKKLSLFHHKKTSKRESDRGSQSERSGHLPYTDINQSTTPSGIFHSDDRVSSTETMTLLENSHNDIFNIKQNRVFPRRILVNGNPGVGKSTLLCKLAHDWAVVEDVSPLKQVKVLIHLSLKGVPKKASVGEEVKNQLLSKDTQFNAKQIEECIRRNACDVVMLLDGFDESVFAFMSQNPKEADYGNLYAAIKYEQFRTCRIIITVRTWKESYFRGDLFNPYAEVFVSGFARASIKLFIHGYCNVVHEKQMKELIAKDLTNLRPILRVPLFLAMVCEMVSNNILIESPFTLTSLMSQFCEYLFKQYQDRYRERPHSSDYCLGVLGRVALKSYFTEATGDTDTPSDHDSVVNFSLKVGLISTSQKKYTEQSTSETEYYFFHSLLRDFCVARYFVSERMDHRDPIFPSKIDYNRWYYVLLFQCGLSLDRLQTLLSTVLEDIHPTNSLKLSETGRTRQVDFTKESLLIQCYFENQHEKDHAVMSALLFNLRCIAVQMDILNSLSATDHLLSNIIQSKSGFHISEFGLLGENYVHIVDNDLDKDEDDYSVRTLEIGYFKNLISKCPFVTSIHLMDSNVTLCEQTEHFSKRFEKINEIILIDCRGFSTVKNLIYCLLAHCPNIKSLQFQNITSLLSPKQLDIGDTFVMLSNLGTTFKTILLTNMASWRPLDSLPTGDIHWMEEDTELYIHEIKCATFINMKEAFKALAACLSKDGVMTSVSWNAELILSAAFSESVNDNSLLQIRLKTPTCNVSFLSPADVKALSEKR